MTKLLEFLVARLTEKSTVVTIVTLVTGVVGVQVAPEQKDLIVTAVIGVVSAVAAFWGTDKPAA